MVIPNGLLIFPLESISFVLLLWTSREKSLCCSFCRFGWDVAEGLGVNYGLIFGQYIYGDALGWKVAGVPWLIGVNWSILTLCCGAIAANLADAFISRVFLGVGLMLLLDFVIEPIAPILDFWTFDGGIAPLQNYVGWFAVPYAAFLYQYMVQIKGTFTHHLYLLQIVFFTLLLLQINTLQNAL